MFDIKPRGVAKGYEVMYTPQSAYYRTTHI